MLVSALACLTVPALVAASASAKHDIWNVKRFSNIITFGDSYTDESRFLYFIVHNGSAPSPGTRLSEGLATSSGGRIWSRYVVQYTGNTQNETWIPQLDLYNYAVSGASCSNAVTPRFTSLIHNEYPSVLEYQVPAFAADLGAQNCNVNTTAFTVPPTATNSLYALWIGTNDLGVGTFLTDSQVPGKVLSDYTNCVYDAFDGLYKSGARVFVLMNTVPLELTPLYANSTSDGTTRTQTGYWPDKPSNLTAVSEQIREYTSTVNNVFKYQTPFETLIARRYPGAFFALFDVHSLFSDIYREPSQFFNGTQPINVTSPVHVCIDSILNCTDAFGRTSDDSFMWYDGLHPSEQTHRIVARNFVDVMNGVSKYATYY